MAGANDSMCTKFYCYRAEHAIFRQTSALNRIGCVWDGKKYQIYMYKIAYAFRMHLLENL